MAVISECGDNARVGIVGCGATYSGRMAHSVAPVDWSERMDGRAHATFAAVAVAESCWKGGVMREPSSVGLVLDERGVWVRAGSEATAAARTERMASARDARIASRGLPAAADTTSEGASGAPAA